MGVSVDNTSQREPLAWALIKDRGAWRQPRGLGARGGTPAGAGGRAGGGVSALGSGGLSGVAVCAVRAAPGVEMLRQSAGLFLGQ